MQIRKRRKRRVKPIFLMVSKVTAAQYEHEMGEVSGAVQIKMSRKRAQDLFHFLNDELSQDSDRAVTFTLEGIPK
jgi:hypothetical protein